MKNNNFYYYYVFNFSLFNINLFPSYWKDFCYNFNNSCSFEMIFLSAKIKKNKNI
jgi:hypothetical protein